MPGYEKALKQLNRMPTPPLYDQAGGQISVAVAGPASSRIIGTRSMSMQRRLVPSLG